MSNRSLRYEALIESPALWSVENSHATQHIHMPTTSQMFHEAGTAPWVRSTNRTHGYLGKNAMGRLPILAS